MNIFQLIAEDVKRGVRILGGIANIVVSGYTCMCWACWLVNQNIVVIGKWSLGMCGMGGLFFVIKRGVHAEEMYAREKERKELAEETTRRLLYQLYKAEHAARILRVNREYDIERITCAYDRNACITYNIFDDTMNRLIHKCNQQRVNKEIENGLLV